MPRCRFFIAALITAVLLITGTASSQTVHNVLSGDFGNLNITSGNRFTDLSVVNGQSGKVRSTYLIFDVWYSPTDVVSGYGYIPTTALSGKSTSQLELNVDLAALDIETYHCVYDSSGNPICTPIAISGTVHVVWSRTNFSSRISNISETERFPGRTMKTRGRSEVRSAVATGNVLDFAFNAVNAEVGKTHELDMLITRTKQ